MSNRRSSHPRHRITDIPFAMISLVSILFLVSDIPCCRRVFNRSLFKPSHDKNNKTTCAPSECSYQPDTEVINCFHAQLNWAWNFNCSQKLKCWNIKTFLAFRLWNVAFNAVFMVSGPVLLKNPKFLWFSMGSGPPVPPLDPHMDVQVFQNVCYTACLSVNERLRQISICEKNYGKTNSGGHFSSFFKWLPTCFLI